jgi:uncharacterized protein (TIGR04255 family)
MRERIAELQEGLRAQSLPRFQESVIQNVFLMAGGAPEVTSKKRWDFLDRDRRTVLTLTDEVLVLQTSAYDTFEPFVDAFAGALQLVGEIAGLALVERVGYRAIDVIAPQPSEKLSSYLIPGLVGFPFDDVPNVSSRPQGFRVESVAETAKGSLLAIRCYQLPRGQFLPPDLIPTPLTYPVHLTALDNAAALDFDHFSTATIDFSVDSVVDTLWFLHGSIGTAFRHSVTKHAWDVWEATEETLE